MAKAKSPRRGARRVGSGAAPELGEVLDFLRVIWAVDHGLHRASKRAELELGVTGPQRLVLRIAGRFPGIPAGHLAELLHLHPSTLTGVLQRLEAQGLLRRRVDPRDARRSLLGLTEKGRRFDLRTAGAEETAIAATLARTAPEKLKAAREVLESISSILSGSAHPDEHAVQAKSRAKSGKSQTRRRASQTPW
jgi:MarR family transcriptional regulator, organic hydroperoxide resistance regulator